MYVHIRMYVLKHTYFHIHTYTCMCTYVHMCTYVRMCAYVRMCMYVGLHSAEAILDYSNKSSLTLQMAGGWISGLLRCFFQVCTNFSPVERRDG